MRRFLLFAVLFFAVLPAVAAVEEVQLPIVPFVFDHELGIQTGIEMRLTSGITLGLMGMAGRANSVDGVIVPNSHGDDFTWPHPHPVTFHVDERSTQGFAFKVGIPVWKRHRERFH